LFSFQGAIFNFVKNFFCFAKGIFAEVMDSSYQPFKGLDKILLAKFYIALVFLVFLMKFGFSLRRHVQRYARSKKI